MRPLSTKQKVEVAVNVLLVHRGPVIAACFRDGRNVHMRAGIFSMDHGVEDDVVVVVVVLVLPQPARPLAPLTITTVITMQRLSLFLHHKAPQLFLGALVEAIGECLATIPNETHLKKKIATWPSASCRTSALV